MDIYGANSGVTFGHAHIAGSAGEPCGVGPARLVDLDAPKSWGVIFMCHYTVLIHSFITTTTPELERVYSVSWFVYGPHGTENAWSAGIL
jgi:hypothetical protein